jgi:ribonuclease P protein component
MDRVSQNMAPTRDGVAPLSGRPAVDSKHAQNRSRSYGDEKNLSTQQCPTQTHSRLSRTHGYAWRPQRAQASACQGPPSADGGNSAQTARLTAQSDARFTPQHRLHRRADFLAVQRCGIRQRTRHFLLQMLLGLNAAGPKLGITVPRRVGTAVARNRLKRRVRECFRLKLKTLLPQDAALVVLGLPGAGELNFAAIERELIGGVEVLAHKCEGYKG